MAPNSWKKRQTTKAKKRNVRKCSDQQNGECVKKGPIARVTLDNEMLIDEVRARQAIWQRNHDNHFTTQQLLPLWEDVGNALGTTSEDVRRRWKNLKDNYRRELKKFIENPSAPTSKWPYFKQMSFVRKMIYATRRSTNIYNLNILDSLEDSNNQTNLNGQQRNKQEESEAIPEYVDAVSNYRMKIEQAIGQDPSLNETESPEETYRSTSHHENINLHEQDIITVISSAVSESEESTLTTSLQQIDIGIQQSQELSPITHQTKLSRLSLQQHSNISTLQQSRIPSPIHDLRDQMALSSNPQDISELEEERLRSTDDYHFFMSLIPHVQHFTSVQKLKIRNKIQQIIIEETSSNCQHDPLRNC